MYMCVHFFVKTPMSSSNETELPYNPTVHHRTSLHTPRETE